MQEAWVYVHVDVAVNVLERHVVDLWVQLSIKQLCHWRCLDYSKHMDGVDLGSKENHIAGNLVVEGEEDKIEHLIMSILFKKYYITQKYTKKILCKQI